VFVLGFLGVLLDLGFRARVHSQSIDNFSVTKRHASKNNVVVGKWDASSIRKRFIIAAFVLADVRKNHISVELVDLVVGGFAVEMSRGERVELRGGVENTGEFLGRTLVLQIGFAVQVLGLDVGDSLDARGVDQEQVSWEKLVLRNFDDLADPDVVPVAVFEGTSLRVVDMSSVIIFLVVRLVALVVFIGVLDHGQGNDKHEGWKHRRFPVRDRNYVHQLHERDQDEIHIRPLTQLDEQIQRQK